jgi:transcriptional regulator with XRE-family HTH domain
MQIGQKIKKLRELKNFTQEYMADQMDMTQPSYSKIESGETDVSYSKLEKIAKSLEIRPEDIMTFNENMVFNVMHNKDGQNGLVINQMSNDVKVLYENQISSLKSENEHLKHLLDRVLKK